MNDYIILMPMRNEIATIRDALDNIAEQSVIPDCLYVLDDGSTDGSSEVVKDFVSRYSWITHIQIPDRGYDQVGKGVAVVLNHGVAQLDADNPPSYIAKVDADLKLPIDYFEKLLEEMNTNSNLAVCAGHPYTFEDGKRILERHGDHFPTGTARLYNYEKLKEIGFFVESVGWDTVDLIRFQLRGYDVRTIHSIEHHHIRRMGTRNGYRDGMIRDGRNAFLTGYVPSVFIIRALYNIRHKPYLSRTICMLWGYFSTWVKNPPRVVNQQEYEFHKTIQYKKINPANIFK